MTKTKSIDTLPVDRLLVVDTFNKIDDICGGYSRVHEDKRHPLLETRTTHGEVKYAKKSVPMPSLQISLRNNGGLVLRSISVSLSSSGEARFMVNPVNVQKFDGILPDLTHSEEMILPTEVSSDIVRQPFEAVERTVPVRAAQAMLYFIEASHKNRTPSPGGGRR